MFENISAEKFEAMVSDELLCKCRKSIAEASSVQLHNAVAAAAVSLIMPEWCESEKRHSEGRLAYYLSMEFLMGRAVYNNLYCAGVLDTAKEMLAKNGVDIAAFEDIEDAALGNGGLGRLAACFLDSAATHDIPLNGYGIRYRYGLFKQYINGGFQGEEEDAWLEKNGGDAWSVRCEDDSVTVDFADFSVSAVPYDMPIIGYGLKSVNTLRLWQSEPLRRFNFTAFDNQDYLAASAERIKAEAISDVLYPNDNSDDGRRLRIRQEYFFSSASLQDMLRSYRRKYGSDFSKFADCYAVQLNDTHPTVAIPEIIRLLMFREGMSFDDAFDIAQKTFHYTNHTVMAEALEKWNNSLFKSILPTIYEIIGLIDRRLKKELSDKGVSDKGLAIIDGGSVHMARMAVYATSHTNGVAQLHTDILKESVLADWYKLYPERFKNKTNGITPRRWLGLCNKELSAEITEKIGDKWITDLTELKRLAWWADDAQTLDRFNAIKHEKKRQLADFIRDFEGFELNPDFIFDIQIKRLHEYKRQLLNAFSIVDIYFQMKDGKLNDMPPTAFIFGAKAAPAYRRAKGIIKYINEVAKLVNSDPDVKDRMAVLFVHNYNVSYAEKLIPAADISEQISTAGTEASGTGNMKFMLNGAVTLGTYDGANVEIVAEAGRENEYIFGARVEQLESILPTYRPKQKIYEKNERVKRVLNTLVDGTFNDGDTGMFYDLFKSLTDGFSWHKPDNYFLLGDMEGYIDTKLNAIYDYRDRRAFAKKCWLNICGSGKFSSDRTVREYAEEIWELPLSE